MSSRRPSDTVPDMMSVPQFYQNRSVFVTGGTGFMGKVLVEKLLYSCPGVRHIYLLMRPKKGRDLVARLAEITNSPLFDRLRKERPSDLHKIIPILGDVTEPGLGISASDQALLIQEVSVVFHSAATLKFDEALKLSVTINMLGTRRLIELCHQMLGLEALIHVSTAYCNCDRKVVQEVVYPAPCDPQRIIDCVEWMDSEQLDHLTPKLIGTRPNTYTFTKALAEHMLVQESGNLPVAIVRPSIVLCSLSDPFPGWVDNLNGPTGLLAACAKGLLRSMYGRPEITADVVPVDFVINFMIVSAWHTAMDRNRANKSGSGDIKVFNVCSGIQNPITWGALTNISIDSLRKHPVKDALWWPMGQVRSSRLVHQLNLFFFHLVPGCLFDGLAFLVGKKPVMLTIQAKLEKARNALEFFTLNEWRFLDDNVNEVNAMLSPEDRAKFQFCVRDINWDDFLEHYAIGIRKFIFKEDSSSLPLARSRLRRLYWLHRFIQFIPIFLLWRFVISRTTLGKPLGYILVNTLLKLHSLITQV